jgi:hypothetical protein
VHSLEFVITRGAHIQIWQQLILRNCEFRADRTCFHFAVPCLFLYREIDQSEVAVSGKTGIYGENDSAERLVRISEKAFLNH